MQIYRFGIVDICVKKSDNFNCIIFLQKALAKPSGFAGNAGESPCFSRICGQDACAARGLVRASDYEKNTAIIHIFQYP